MKQLCEHYHHARKSFWVGFGKLSKLMHIARNTVILKQALDGGDYTITFVALIHHGNVFDENITVTFSQILSES